MRTKGRGHATARRTMAAGGGSLHHPLAELLHLLGTAGPQLWIEVRTARERGPAWAVLITDAKRIALDQAPAEVLACFAYLRPGQALAVALPVDDIIGGLGLHGDRFGAMAREIREEPPPGDCRFVVMTGRVVMTLTVPAAEHITPVHVGLA